MYLFFIQYFGIMSNVGGALSLFLGISGVTIVELLELIIMVTLAACGLDSGTPSGGGPKIESTVNKMGDPDRIHAEKKSAMLTPDNFAWR
jgi:hypothetical protein